MWTEKTGKESDGEERKKQEQEESNKNKGNCEKKEAEEERTCNGDLDHQRFSDKLGTETWKKGRGGGGGGKQRKISS